MVLTKEIIQEMDWKIFEDLCCAYFVELGYEAETTSVGEDGGIDVKLFNSTSGKKELKMIAQCKRYAGKSTVGVKDLREFLGVITANQVESGIFITSSIFNKKAEAFAKEQAGMIQIGDGERITKLINKLPQKAKERLFNLATPENYKVPTCVRCDIKMIKRNNSATKDTFWGCVTYPKCKYTQNIAKKPN